MAKRAEKEWLVVLPAAEGLEPGSLNAIASVRATSVL